MKRILRLAILFLSIVITFANVQAQITAWNLTSAITTATSANANITATTISVVPSS